MVAGGLERRGKAYLRRRRTGRAEMCLPAAPLVHQPDVRVAGRACAVSLPVELAAAVTHRRSPVAAHHPWPLRSAAALSRSSGASATPEQWQSLGAGLGPFSIAGQTVTLGTCDLPHAFSGDAGRPDPDPCTVVASGCGWLYYSLPPERRLDRRPSASSSPMCLTTSLRWRPRPAAISSTVQGLRLSRSSTASRLARNSGSS